MISILKGTAIALKKQVGKQFILPNDFVLGAPEAFIRPFTLIRMLTPFIREKIGDGPVDHLLALNQTHISAIYEGLSPALNDEQRAERQVLAARLDSNITHSPTAKAALLSAATQLVLELHAQSPFRLIVTDVRALDSNSVDLLKFMYYQYPNQVPDLVLGYTPNWGDDQHLPEFGISWYFGHDTVTALQSFTYAFEAAAAVCEDIGNELGDSNFEVEQEAETALRSDKFDTNAEFKAYQLLKSNLPIDEEQRDQLLAGIQKCFELYDFTNALLLGLEAKRIYGHQLTQAQKGTLLHIIGLSAHNRHFFTQGNHALANFLHNTFTEALTCETNLAIRVCLLYRLIVTVSRRKNDLANAQFYVDHAYAELERFSNSKQLVALAWIKNVHSYMRMKEGKLDEAIQLHEEAYFLLDGAVIDTDLVSADEVNFTKAVLAENLSTLNNQRRNTGEMRRWYALETAYTEKSPYLFAVTYAEWQSFYYQQLQLQPALENARKGLTASKASFNYILEYFFNLSLAEISNRLGDVPTALHYYTNCLAFQEKIGHSYVLITQFSLRVAIVNLLIETQAWEEATVLLHKMTIPPETTATNEYIVVNELLATCAAHTGNASLAETYINRAIDNAVKAENSGLLLIASLAAANVSQLLARNDDAYLAYAQALELATTSVSGEVTTVSATNQVRLHLGLLSCGAITSKSVSKVLHHFPQALKESAANWWLLKSFFVLHNTLTAAEQQQLKTAAESGFNLVYEAAAQRSDCLHLLNTKIVKTLPTS